MKSFLKVVLKLKDHRPVPFQVRRVIIARLADTLQVFRRVAVRTPRALLTCDNI